MTGMEGELEVKGEGDVPDLGPEAEMGRMLFKDGGRDIKPRSIDSQEKLRRQGDGFSAQSPRPAHLTFLSACLSGGLS